ncbi:MAG: hypothetical protein LBI60_01345, partial [Bacteroidales bacterium]|nr:hypothetical protein [Bacteroidales bacterium]
NIQAKFDVGNYQYANGNHAVSGITDNASSYTPAAIDIASTSYNRPSSLVQQGSLIKKLEFQYGPDNLRRRSRYYENNALRKTVYYLGNYEKEVASGISDREYDYICTPEGLSAIAVKANGTRSLYYVQTDHLGSIRVVTTASQGFQTRYYYDAWGKQTLMSGSRITNRGYIGEEHLNDFGLINLNARLYDPVLGRFMGIDPYVQAADFTQSYNRYSYALNNPLRYTDPDGEFWHIVIGAVVGGVINLGIKAYQGKINSWGDGFAAFGIGAAAGAIGAATGGAAFAAAGGAAGGAGGFLAGAAGGAVGTAVSSPVLSMGNTAYFGDPMMTGQQYLLGIAGGALLGGSVNGITALANGRNFMTGNLPSSNAPITPTVSQPAPTQQSNNAQPNQSTTQPQTQLEQNRVSGRIAEDVSGINQANKVRIPSATETANYRIPDELTSTTLREIKNVSYLDYTPQLQDFVKYSQQNSLQMQLWIRPAGTIYGLPTQLSPSLLNTVNQGYIRIFYIPF